MALPVEVALTWSAIEERVTAHCEDTARVLLAEAGSPHMYYEEDLRRPFALIIGNELLSGKVEEANLGVLARSLRGLGISLVGLVLVLVLIERPKTMLAWTHTSAPMSENEAS